MVDDAVGTAEAIEADKTNVVVAADEADEVDEAVAADLAGKANEADVVNRPTRPMKMKLTNPVWPTTEADKANVANEGEGVPVKANGASVAGDIAEAKEVDKSTFYWRRDNVHIAAVAPFLPHKIFCNLCRSEGVFWTEKFKKRLLESILPHDSICLQEKRLEKYREQIVLPQEPVHQST
jgi:hypothetical protein